ncbi:RsmB/NOP family class I SAM-dependent RNA methyltransferase [Paenibacillus sp. N4]|uniref:RsmB/NOP family class I SAM-dependent RNA methyltransferase n=1 Tax=Paenibacillus vietnamensis TaxID=2590547 RepID=UPI001CD0A316|nr:RsmB/NOP family class I SAM-dependent RNA methyltransferase [Paenibacillus vietnamensis]MCA0754639.1 RsmB/NOP family class I SAM-dependent RNA methyltransferase [Paenibacillus vietnamensis]
MIGHLPRQFTEKMKQMLGREYDKFMSSYSDPRVYGLRINRLKLSKEEWKRLSDMGPDMRPIPWAEDGLYYGEGERPGKHPHYHAGLYYIQEPSAMAPVELLDVRPGHRVLDLCAAPGGKSTQIAAKLQGLGVLVTNDNARERTKALAKNIELAGVRNAVILNEEPASLLSAFAGWFDRILIDAPCSGEGMFRKDDSMVAEWEKHSVERCSLMQRNILRDAAKLLAPGGLLVYSTCTFSPEENEEQIAAFLAEHPDFQVVPVEHRYGWQPGRPDLVAAEAGLSKESLQSLAGTVRLWPHHIVGEGHYAAVLKRNGERNESVTQTEADEGNRITDAARETKAVWGIGPKPPEKRPNQREERREAKLQTRKAWRNGESERPNGKRDGRVKTTVETVDPYGLWREQAGQFAAGAAEWEESVIAYGSKIYLQPANLPSLDGLRVVRAGWYVAEAVKGRLVPTQPLAMGLKREEAVRSVNWSAQDPRTLRYLRGETVFVNEQELELKDGASPKGYVLVCTDGYPIGWGKYAGGMIKNELPAGWRWM